MRKKIPISILCIIVLIVFIACQPYHHEFEALGTFCTIDLLSGGSQKIAKKSEALVKKIDSILSVNIDTSEISQINRQAGLRSVELSPETLELLAAFMKYSAEFNGLLDPAILPIVQLWGIGGTSPHIPSQEEITRTLKLCDISKIKIKGSTIFLEEKGMGIDIGSIGKGWAADKVAEYLSGQGVKSGILSLGGNIILVGKKSNGKDWNIGIRNPLGASGDYCCIVSLKGGSAVTSGIYERFFEKDGKRYHHIIDPRTGYPADNELAGVTIFTQSSTRADAYSTGVFILGLKEGMKFIESSADAEALFVTKDKKIYFSSGLAGRVEISDAEFSFDP